MEAGALRHEITLQSPTRTVNAAGETTIAWTDVHETRANVRALRSWQQERARQVQMNTTHVVEMRYYAGIGGDWRIKWGDVFLNITGIVNPDGRNIDLEITCEQERVTS